MEKIIFDGGKEYIKRTKELKADGNKVCDTARYTAEKNGRVECMIRTIKNAISTMLIHSSVPENL